MTMNERGSENRNENGVSIYQEIICRFICVVIVKKTAVLVCTLCICKREGLLCKKCAKKHKCGEEMLLCVCNSSRGGGCRYEGSRYYLDQFVSDCEENVHKDSKELFKNNF
ncbi:MAG: hypothetical protein OSJ61_02210 [Lachnospiraceae bacterium]|nr:hypothetical protein [Lachnospiraceae bacterium]